MANPMFQMSANTRFIYQELQKLAEDEVITYEDLEKVCGFEVSGATPELQSAKRQMLHNFNVVIETVRCVGVKRLNSKDILKSTDKEVNAIRRNARKGRRKLHAVDDYAKLSNAEQLNYTIKGAVFTMSEEVASERARKKLEAVAKTDLKPDLGLAKTAAALIRLMK